MKRTQLTVTFGEYDDDVYWYLRNKRNASGFIRRLVRTYMSGESVEFEKLKNERILEMSELIKNHNETIEQEKTDLYKELAEEMQQENKEVKEEENGPFRPEEIAQGEDNPYVGLSDL